MKVSLGRQLNAVGKLIREGTSVHRECYWATPPKGFRSQGTPAASALRHPILGTGERGGPLSGSAGRLDSEKPGPLLMLRNPPLVIHFFG